MGRMVYRLVGGWNVRSLDFWSKSRSVYWKRIWKWRRKSKGETSLSKHLPLLILFISLSMLPAFATTRPPQYCFENQTDMCGLASGDPVQIFSGILQPLEEQLPGFSMVIFWGGIMAIIWFKTENIMLLGVIGIVVNATITAFSDTAQGIGLMMLVAANGFLLFQLLRQRVQLFS